MPACLPPTGTEEACLRVHGSRTITCTDSRGTKTYNFDQVLYQASQEDVYEGMPVVSGIKRHQADWRKLGHLVVLPSDGCIVSAPWHAVVGMPMVDHCMAGYNSSIFAYGQVRWCAKGISVIIS